MNRKKLVIGILAHVDAGKTTLAESLLYVTGSIRKAGRVDHRDTFLDTDELERARGITIFSKQAEFSWKNTDVTLLDTPGHVDFSAEMERTLQVLDYAVLVISGADGIQGHVMTLWKLLKQYRIPVFLFINKMDQQGCDKSLLLWELQERLSGQCIDFTAEDDAFFEELAVCEDSLLEKYLERGKIEKDEIAALIAGRKVFPCYFGSALKIEGMETLLDGINQYSLHKKYLEAFGARVFKISRDDAGNRLTFLKVTGGSLQVKQAVRGNTETGRKPEKDAKEEWEEKVNQIRIYSGVKYTMLQEAPAGTVCAVTGLSRTYAGEGLGTERGWRAPILVPVLTYRIILPPENDIHDAYVKLCQLEEEEPQLHIVWKEPVGEIHAQLMGEVQTEVLQNLIAERFGLAVEFDEGSILYKETIRSCVEGVGHFEPLRHYAEVHLLLEPGEPDSGLAFASTVSEDELDRNWQRLILTHLEEKEHLGVLTGSPVTDLKITLAAGKAHLKHTEGGDFRQATYRAVRQGLCRAESILLEPVYAFRMEIPSSMIGRAMSDIQAMSGRFDAPAVEGDTSVLMGTAPVVTMRGYQTELLSYSGGCGRLFCSLKGYEPCHNAEEVIEQLAYDPERDPDNPASSVFCAHGAGYVVAWQDVERYMHLESVLVKRSKTGNDIDYYSQFCDRKTEAGQGDRRSGSGKESGQNGGSILDGQGNRSGQNSRMAETDRELEEIFRRTYGKTERKRPGYQKVIRAGGGSVPGADAASKAGSAPKADTASKAGSAQGADAASKSGSVPETRTEALPERERRKGRAAEKKREYLLVDGYNIIFAWEELSELAKVSLDGARGKLMDILSNYQGYRKMTLILVFDAYKVKGNPGSVTAYHNIHVVYTKEAETADQYIEKAVHEIAGKHQVTVATSDGLEQLIIMGQGAGRLSARELKEEIMSTNRELREQFLDRKTDGRQYLFDELPEDLAEHMENVRLGRQKF